MWPEQLSASAEDGYITPSNAKYSLGALSDSTYEYLVKVCDVFAS